MRRPTLLLLLAWAGCEPRIPVGEAFARAEACTRRGDLSGANRWLDQARTGLAGDVQEQRMALLEAEVGLEGDDVSVARRILANNADRLSRPGPWAARRAWVLGRLHHKVGDLERAEHHLTRAISVAGADAVQRAEAEVHLASLLSALGRVEDSEAHARQALTLMNSRGDRRLKAMALTSLGYSAMSRGRYGEAMSLLDPALDEARAAGAEALVARVQLNRGVSSNWLGDFERGRAHLQEAARIRERLGLVSGLRNVFGSLGDSYWLDQQPEAAIPFYQRALAVSRRHAPASVPQWASNLAIALISLQRWPEARQANEEARSHSISLPSLRLVADLNAAFIARGEGDIETAEAALLRLRGRSSDAHDQWAIESALAPVLAARGRVEQAERAYERAFQQEEAARNGLRGIADQLQFSALRIRLHQEYVEWLVSRGRVGLALEAVESARARVLREVASGGRASLQPRRQSLQQVVGRRPGVLVSFWIAPTRSFAWVLERRGVRVIELPPEAEVRAAVQSYRTFIERSRRDPRELDRSPASRLYDLLIAPLELPPATTAMTICPDGPLFAVPFGALVHEAQGRRRFLLEGKEISVALSLADLSGDARRHTADDRFLVIGDPIPTPGFPALPNAAPEVERIVTALGGRTTVLHGADASPEAFLNANLQGFFGAHFAAHSVAHPSSPLDASVVLSPGKRGDRLSVRDIISIRAPLELVTLSSCKGAGERILSGEGMLGLTWGFIASGTRNVVASLWDVGDASTAEVMSHFYRQLATGLTPPRALRAAQLALIQRGDAWSKPYHWAAFQPYVGGGGSGGPCPRPPCNDLRASRTP